MDNLTSEELLRRRLERAWIRGWVDRIQHERKKPSLDRDKEIEEIMQWDGNPGEPYLIQSEG